MMMLNYLKIAFRNLINNKTYSLINVAGLAIGLAVSFLILLFVMHELSYDRFNSNHERIFRVAKSGKVGDEQLQFAAFPADLAPSLKERNPYVEDYVRWMSLHSNVVIRNPDRPDRMFYEKEILYADPSILKVFSFNLKKGSADHALQKPNSIVISRKMAEKYFADSDPIGKTLSLEGEHILQVTGIVENQPSNSSFQFDFLLPLDAFPVLNGVDRSKWHGGGSFNTYLLLNSDKYVTEVESDLNKMTSKNADAYDKLPYSLENLASIHLSEDYRNPGKTKLVYVFAGIAILILFLALFNYMSLTTARATLRVKEVGIRKFVGSGRIALIKQFYTEAFLMCFLAFLLGAVLVELFRQPFYELLDLHIDTSFILSPAFLGFLLSFFCITVMIAGSYPALMISGFAPLNIINGKVAGNFGGSSIRKLFMVFQFAVSTALIICSMIVKYQVSYMQNRELGLYKDQVLSIPVRRDSIHNLFALKDELVQQAGVQSASISDLGLFRSYNIWSIKDSRTNKKVNLYYLVTDPGIIKTLGIKWKIAPSAGTFASRKHVLLNEAAVKAFDIEKEPLGKSVNDLDEVAGVLNDFQFTSPRDGIKPMALMIEADAKSFSKEAGSGGILYARLDPKADVKSSIQEIEQKFSKYYPGRPFDYYFLDDAFNQTIKTEIRMAKMFAVFTGLAIFIACVGLFGLVTFTAEVRTKEIGIRKVLGASVARIVALISQDFARLVIISITISIPVAWYFMDKWLQDFHYRIELSWWMFAGAAALAIVIAFITISFQSIRAALMNPVESLKRE